MVFVKQQKVKLIAKLLKYRLNSVCGLFELVLRGGLGRQWKAPVRDPGSSSPPPAGGGKGRMLLRHSLPTSNVEVEPNAALFSLGNLGPGLFNRLINRLINSFYCGIPDFPA